MDEVVNTEQLAAWDGDEGEHWSTHEEHYDATVHVYAQHLHDVAAVDGGEQVLDLGCGCGATTRDAARAARDGAAVGIDLSSPMLARARTPGGRGGARERRPFVHGDAQVHSFPPATFDVVISRFGAMFFADPVAAFANVAGAMRPDGRLALVAWQTLDAQRVAHRDAGRPGPGSRPADTAGRGAGAVRLRRARITCGRSSPRPAYGDVEVDELDAPFWFGRRRRRRLRVRQWTSARCAGCSQDLAPPTSRRAGAR